MDCRANNVPIADVVVKLGLETFSKGPYEFGLYFSGEKTDGRAYNTEKNIVTDFTGKERGEGGPFSFVKSYLKLTDHETFIWFEDKFLSYKPEEAKETANKIFLGLSGLQDIQIQYLKSRGIDYDKIKDCVKNYNGGIACLIRNNNIPVGINCRSLSSDHKKRFFGYTGLSTSGIYKHGIDSKKDYLIVVEGLIDFLTLRQYETNVVGLKSAEDGIQDVLKLSMEYRLIFVFDNDVAGSTTKDKFSSIKFKYFNRSGLGEEKCKDVNDMYQYAGDMIIEYIMGNLIADTPILRTIEKYKLRQQYLKENGKLGIDGPYMFYDKTSGIVEGKVYTIGAFSNTGKSKLAYAHASYFLKKGRKVLYISVEESEEDMFGNILSAYSGVDIDKLGDLKINEKNFENLILNDSLKTIPDIDALLKIHKPRILIIDYAQGLQAKGGSSYEKHSNIALGIQQLAIQNKCSVFSLCQLSNETLKSIQTNGLYNSDVVSMKGAGEYYAASDVIFVMAKEGRFTRLKIEKNKLGRRGFVYEMDIGWTNNSFKFQEMEHPELSL